MYQLIRSTADDNISLHLNGKSVEQVTVAEWHQEHLSAPYVETGVIVTAEDFSNIFISREFMEAALVKMNKTLGGE